MMEIEQLWKEIDQHIPRLGEEEVPLLEAFGRILSQEPCSTVDQPPLDQSSVDGYALPERGPFRLIGNQVAGQNAGVRLEPGQAVRILTGAVVPEGAFAVIKQEDSSVDGGLVQTTSLVAAGENIRRKGDVLKKGTPVLPPGQQISPGAIGLLASSGIGAVRVICRARVLHMVTGDEIIAAGTPLKSGQIYDSNGPMMAALLRQRGVQQFQQIHLGDSPEEIGNAVAAFDGNLLLISGGSGPGDRDHTVTALEAAGFQIHASRLNSRPGKPLIFATRGAQVAFGLPGNPLSHFVCYQAFVRRALDRLEGFPVSNLIAAELQGTLPENGDGRRTWLPGVLEVGRARPLTWRHSGDLTPLAHANALILLGSDQSVRSDPSARSTQVLPLP